MPKYILVCAYPFEMQMEISHSIYEDIESVESELVKLDLDSDMISEILSGYVVESNGDACYWKLIEVNNVKT